MIGLGTPVRPYCCRELYLNINQKISSPSVSQMKVDQVQRHGTLEAVEASHTGCWPDLSKPTKLPSVALHQCTQTEAEQIFIRSLIQ
jgi:hypothetical protein